MAVPLLTGADLNGQQLFNACLQVLATAPANPGTARTYFDSALGHARIWTGTAWEQSSGVTGGGGTVTTVSATVPAFLAVTVTNPTSTPGIAITSAAALAANQVLATPNGAAGTLGTRALVGADLPVFGPSGAGHAVGAVPDPGATAGTTRFLREDATWVAPSGGTVTSVALSLPALFTVTGSPVTTTGTLTATLATQAANLVWAGPTTGAAVAPAFRALVAADIPKTLDTTWITNFAAGVTAIRLDQMAAPTAAVSMNGQRLTNLLDPVAANEPATKGYADAIQAGLDTKASVRVASTANVAGTYTATGGTSARGQFTAMPNTLDGVTLAAGNRVLLKDQTAGAQNGIWVVTTLGTGTNGVWDRATDFDADAEVTAGAYTFVAEGAVNADNGYQLITNDPITIGGATGTALVWTQFSGAGQITAGAGMTKTGNTLDVGTASAARIVVNADNIDLATVVTAGTAVIVTYDAYGRVTAGADLIAANGLPARTAANTYAARTITGTANQIAVTNGDGVAGNPTLAFAAGARTSLGAPGKYATTVGNGAATSFTIAQTAHGLATDGTILVQIMDAITGAVVFPDVSIAPTTGTVTITFTVAPAANAYRALLIG
jgi:hypothetical protein